MLVLADAERRWREKELRPYLNEQRLRARMDATAFWRGQTIVANVTHVDGELLK